MFSLSSMQVSNIYMFAVSESFQVNNLTCFSLFFILGAAMSVKDA